MLTEGFITLSDTKIKEKEYPNNFVPRKHFSIYYVISGGGKRYINAYKRFYFIHSRLYSRVKDRL
jgi:hypothetical protein